MSKILAKVHVRRLPGQMGLCLQYMQGGKLILKILDFGNKPVKGVSFFLKAELISRFIELLNNDPEGNILWISRLKGEFISLREFKKTDLQITVGYQTTERQNIVCWLRFGRYPTNIMVGRYSFCQALSEIQKQMEVLGH